MKNFDDYRTKFKRIESLLEKEINIIMTEILKKQ